jgi:hypothetical protein
MCKWVGEKAGEGRVCRGKQSRVNEYSVDVDGIHPYTMHRTQWGNGDLPCNICTRMVCLDLGSGR